MESLKNQFFNYSFYSQLTQHVKEVYPKLNVTDFRGAFDAHEKLELMDRVKQVGDVLFEVLPGTYLDKLHYIKELGPKITGFQGIALPYFVQQYGLDYFDESMDALHYLTRFSTAEFAIRPFLKQNLERSLELIYTWAKDENNHVRRLASEGTRPYLPWSFKLDEVRDNPQLTLPILNTLQSDADLYVKKSVGNHLNDLSKNHPQLVVDTVSNWSPVNKHSQWMAKRGVRTLIKDGFAPAFAIMGFEKLPQFVVENFKVENNTVQMGQSLEFSFVIKSEKTTNQKLNIDFQIFYLKSNGKHQPKVFKLKELDLGAKETLTIAKKQLFKDFTTRKHYMENHFVYLLINGVAVEKLRFELIA